MKLYFFQHTILMKFGRPLYILVHYTVQFNLECCKSSVHSMCLNTILKIKIIIIRRLKSEKKNSKIQSSLNFSRPLVIIVYYTVQFNLECCKPLCPTWALILF